MKDEALSNDGVKVASFPLANLSEDFASRIAGLAAKAPALVAAVSRPKAAIADWLRHEFGVLKPSRALERPHLLDADGFVTAVRAAIVRSKKWSAADIARLKADMSRR